MTRPLKLLIAIHNHQPDGNFGHVFQQAYDDCYRPLLQALSDAPHVRVALHHTGALFEWIERERPEYFEELRALVQRGQVELLGGGFYEPMLAVLPERDARGQIEMMSSFVEQRFGVRPEGMWLAERVWEPALAKLIADAGMKFTLVDDGHFRAAGVDGQLRGYYVTEKAGTPLAIFPIDKRLREAIPFCKAWETMDVLDAVRESTPAHLDAAATYGDDGEKFGVWPKTKEWVFAPNHWLREFHRLLGERQDRVRTMHFGEYLRAHPPTGRVYLPTASYEEMGEWALPAEAQERYHEVRASLKSRDELERARAFFRGGIWQGFLAKYPEANFMHKKMVLVSDKLERAQAKLGDGRALDHARRELYRAQCNCCYWHGLFGGLYLNYLRDAVYRHLIEAELHADRVLGVSEAPSTEIRDLDADLQPEVLLADATLAAYVKPDQGGGVYELDYRPKRFNLGNVLGRRPEAYHKKMIAAARGAGDGGEGVKSIHDLVAVKSAGLEDLTTYDRAPRFTFIDHFLGEETSLDELARGRYEERGDFATGCYQVTQQSPGAVTLRRRGNIYGVGATVEKTLTVGDGTLACAWKIWAEQPLVETFAPELNLTLLAGDAPDRYYRVPGQWLPSDASKLTSRGTVEAGAPLELVNEWDRFRVHISATPATALWRHPLETASQSEGGFERTYQGSVILPVWRRIELSAARAFEARVTVEIGPL